MKTIDIDFSGTYKMCPPWVFGVCKFPHLEHCEQMLPMLRKSGVTLLRVDLYPEQMILNANEAQNPETWDCRHLEPLKLAKALGFEIMLSVCYSPDWLNYNHSHKGIPMNFNIYESIIEKAFELVCDYVDYCEVINETVYFMELEDSPYDNKYEAAADIYEHAARAIRKVKPDMRIGGWATEGPFTEEIEFFLSDERFRAETRMVDFISWHVYSSEDCTQGILEIRKTLEACGYPREFPVFIDEWNVTPQWEANDDRLYNYKSLPFVGKNLAYFMNQQVSACFFANYPRLYPSDGFHELAECTTLATYTWDEKKEKGSLLPMMKAYQVPGIFLRLALGEFKVYKVSYSYGLSAVTAAVNIYQEKVIFLVNERPITVEAYLTIAGARKTTTMKCYQISEHAQIESCFECNYEKSEQYLTGYLQLPSYSVTGIVLKEI